MPSSAPPGALLLPQGALLLKRRDGLVLLPPWDGRLRAVWVTEDGTHHPFPERVILFDRRGVWVWPAPLLHADPDATGRADYAAFFAVIPVTARLRMAGRAIGFDPLAEGDAPDV